MLTRDPIYMHKHGWTLDFVSEGSSSEQAAIRQQTIDTMEHLDRVMPGSTKGIQLVVDDPAKTFAGSSDMAGVAAYTESGTNKIVMHPRNFEDYTMKHKVALNVKGWWSGSDPEYGFGDQVLAHEVGHVIANRFGGDGLPTQKVFWEHIASTLNLEPPRLYRSPSEHANETTVRDWYKTPAVQNAVKNLVSEYATSDPAELLAELWSEYAMKVSPREAAKDYGLYMGGKGRVAHAATARSREQKLRTGTKLRGAS
jgi:hypothetical protein